MPTSLYEYSDAEIAGILIAGGFTIAFVFCIGLCSFLYGVKYSRLRSANGYSSKSSVIKEQSESVVRGDHPIAFVLPTVSLSETGSDFSDMDSMTTGGYSSSATSISLSTASPSWRPDAIRLSPNPENDEYYERSKKDSSVQLLREHRHKGGRLRLQMCPPRQHQSVNIERSSSQSTGSKKHLRKKPNSLGKLHVVLHVTNKDSYNNIKIMDAYIYGVEQITSQKQGFVFLLEASMRSKPEETLTAETPIVADQAHFQNVGTFYDVQQTTSEPNVIKFSIVLYKQAKKYSGSAFVNVPCSPHEEEHIIEDVVNIDHAYICPELELGLNYDPTTEKLTLVIGAAHVKDFFHPGNYYVKVTLFESDKVVKAKKTRPVEHTTTADQKHIRFNETFSILFPRSHMDQVSFIISLYSKNGHGNKVVIGRTSIGSNSGASSQGHQHWLDMSSRLGHTVTCTHKLSNTL